LSEYYTETWHSEEDRVKRDAVIIFRGSHDKLRATIKLAVRDYIDVRTRMNEAQDGCYKTGDLGYNFSLKKVGGKRLGRKI